MVWIDPLARWLSKSAVALALGLLAACSGREEATDLARALAERLYPGELEVISTHLQKSNYLVVLGVKGDPVTRINFQTESDPSKCQAGSQCEHRFRLAYDEGKRQGTRLMVLDKVFQACGVPLIAVDGREWPYIELALTERNQDEELRKLAPCAAGLELAAKTDTTGAVPRTVRLGVVLTPSDGPTTAPAPLTFADQLPGARLADPSYSLVLQAGDQAPSRSALSLSVRYLQHSDLHKKLAAAARTFLSSQHPDAHVPTISFANELKLDPERLDVLRAYILACSTRGEGRCREDMAVSLRYDITADTASDFAVVMDIYDERKTLRLPDLPGR